MKLRHPTTDGSTLVEGYDRTGSRLQQQERLTHGVSRTLKRLGATAHFNPDVHEPTREDHIDNF